MSIDREVVITGLGCISASGHNVQQFWQAISAGKSAIAPSRYPERAAFNDAPIAEVSNYEPTEHFPSKSLRLLDRATQYALIAAKEAIADAGLDLSNGLGERAGVIVGSGVGPRHTNDEVLEDYFTKGKPIPPFVIPKGLFSAPTSHISMQFGITGPSWMVTTACASSNHALGQAWELIHSNQVDIAIVGGTDTPLTVPFFDAWKAMRILDPVTCRPFTKNRKGLILGEGAGILVLEAAEHAKERKAKIYAQLSGYGCSSDAFDLIKISPDGATRAIQKALSSAGLMPEDIDYINAHGTGTQLNDATETKVIHDVFGKHASNLMVSSTKSMHGHALGASGSFEFIAIAKTLQEQCVPPTANFSEADSECDLDYVPNIARTAKVRSAMSNAFGFGGVNAVLIASQYN